MNTAFVCSFLLALMPFGWAEKVCNEDVSYNSTLVTKCAGNAVSVLWPNYEDLQTYYKCVRFGKAELQKCPPNNYFTYYFQQCTDCSKFIPPPQCEFLKETTDVECVASTKPTATTTTEHTSKPSPPTEVPSPVPTPPSENPGTAEDIPMPIISATPVPGIPTPPSENVTPPSILAIPPLLEALPSP